MATKGDNSEVERCLRTLLETDGFELTPCRTHGETGVDIIAKKGVKSLHIEVIGYKARGPACAKDFFEAFFRAISRINDGAKTCIIAQPTAAEKGLPKRARQYGEAWRRIGETFPELQIWLIDTENYTYKASEWNDWLR